MNIDNDNIEVEDKTEKIQSLRDMINNAERTIHSAKAMLLQIEGKKKVGRKKKGSDDDGNVIHGTFDGQTMIGTDGKQYPVPANYASKSKLVDGDSLKLTIGRDGAFMYKQIGPVPRQNKIGIVSQDENGNFFIIADNNSYKVLLASITYFHANPGDEVAMVTSSEERSEWATIESVLRSGSDNTLSSSAASSATPSFSESEKQDIVEENDLSLKDENADSIMDEWVPDIGEIEKEIQAEMKTEPAKFEV